MQKHRENYFPMMNKLLGIHKSTPRNNFPVNIENTEDMLLTMELIDIGYLDPDAFFVQRSFEDIKGLIYYGHYPFTEKGYALFKQNIFTRKKNKVVIATLIAVCLAITALLLYLLK